MAPALTAIVLDGAASAARVMRMLDMADVYKGGKERRCRCRRMGATQERLLGMNADVGL